ncbi:unnamed protein product [Dicrocoelium dendriticum]|nr:unnamed protein product [Dicrocoelium dendriticum]
MRPDNVHRIECRIRSEVHLGCYLGRHEDTAVYSDSDYSSSEESDFEDSRTSRSRIHANDALGAICVDFDFGAAWPTKTMMGHSKPVEETGPCIYVLFENGDIVEVISCSSSRPPNRHQFLVKALQILPPSVDNYGEQFCSLLCISAGSVAGRSSALELPPDVLILANRDGRLLQGVVLRSPVASKKRSGHLEGSVLCLLDSVDLGLRSAQNKKTSQLDDLTNTSTLHSDTFDETPPSLALEPSRFSSATESAGFGWLRGTSQSNSSYPFNAYYAIHDTGVHMIRLPWLQNLTTWCQNFFDISLSSLENDVHGAARDWHSVVIHLVCSLVPRSSDTKPSRIDAIRDFRLVGFFELHPLSSMVTSERPVLSSTTDLLFVRSPGKSTAIGSDFVRVLHIPASTNTSFHLSTSEEVSATEREDISEKDKHEKSTVLPCSRFAIQVRRLLRQEELHLPLITDLSLQPSRAQMQGVQFFLQTIKLLRSASLDRLTLARKFVEQYTQRLSNLLPAQYKDACTLASLRQHLQQKAEELTERHAVVLQRQVMLDKRVAALTCRLASLADGPSKADVAMRDELEHLQARLKKGLRNWFDNIKTKRLTLDKRYKELERHRFTTCRGLMLDNAVGVEIDHTQWKRMSDTLKRSTVQIKELVNDVKMLNS